LTPQTTRLNDHPATLPCAVCARKADNGLGWFLVVENSWLDRVRILRWHPTLAEQAEMRGVCCQQHLRSLLGHWLTCANLQFAASEVFRLPVSSDAGMAISGPSVAVVSSLVGELSVHRESLSRAWSGSPQALECILDALLAGLTEEVPPWVPMGPTGDLPCFALPDRPVEGIRAYAFQT
jgi:hypothetical protein